MRRICFSLIFTFVLFACATPEKYDIKLNQLVGADRATVEKEMGKPSAIKILPDGSEILAYIKANDTYVPSEFYLYNQGALTNQEDIYSPFLSDTVQKLGIFGDVLQKGEQLFHLGSLLLEKAVFVPRRNAERGILHPFPWF